MARITLTASEFATLQEYYEDLRPYYSGRGMYDDTCLGYVGGDPHLFMHDLARIIVERDLDGYVFGDDIRNQLGRLGAPVTDSMGRSTIYYLPHVQVEEGVEPDEDY